MPSSEYTSHGGGALKLKGSKPAGIEKKRKKKKASTGIASEEQSPLSKNPVNNPDNQDESEGRNENTAFAEDDSDIAKKGDAPEAQPVIKTKAEREQEERRRKRLDERFKREGLKTHKERVEELNKYLSNLSEHHDMPRIGPG